MEVLALEAQLSFEWGKNHRDDNKQPCYHVAWQFQCGCLWNLFTSLNWRLVSCSSRLPSLFLQVKPEDTKLLLRIKRTPQNFATQPLLEKLLETMPEEAQKKYAHKLPFFLPTNRTKRAYMIKKLREKEEKSRSAASLPPSTPESQTGSAAEASV